MYLVKTPFIIKNLFPNFTWSIPTKEKVLYLTFDDGPIPEVTPWVLQQLKAFQAQATFFCVGDNVQKHSDIFEAVKATGHSIGNHTFNHLNGWATKNIPYVENVRQASNLVNTTLFRPPYGRLRPKQAQLLRQHYKIVMWDVLSGDFDPNLSEESCLKNVIKHAKAGSIVVFHDSLKAEKKVRYVLPKVLEHFSQLGYRFARLNETKI